MINKRLIWYLESNNLISPIQSGFRSERSTNDHLIRLETFIRDAFVNREHVVSVFFDLEKAYDTTWRYGIMKDLHDLGLKGRLPIFIQSFLEDRTMQVRVGSTLSDLYDQEQGVPQGSILSTTSFNIKINNIVTCLDNKTDGSLFVDDFGICFRSQKICEQSRDIFNSVLTELKIGPPTMVLNFLSRKLSAFTSVNFEKFTTILFFIFMDLLYPLLKNPNFWE